MPHRIVLYSKPDCHLCEIAHQLLLELSREFELTIAEIDITRDPTLFKEYFEKIPVLVIDSRTILAAPIHAADVRMALNNN
jgi:glutaredoxin